jgi:glycosyltransferase involved in cell wall biosynthesis
MASGIPTLYHPTLGLLEAVGDAALGVNHAGIGINRDQPDLWAEALRILADERIYSGFRKAALRRSAELDPTEDLNNWCEAVESLG